MSGLAAGTTVDDFADTWNQVAIVTAVAGASFVALGGVTAISLSGLAGFFAANAPALAEVVIGPSLGKIALTPAAFSRVAQSAQALVGRVAGGAAAAAISAGVALFILGTAIESYQIAEAISVPQQIAKGIQEAARDYKDMAGVFQDPSESVYGELFSLFVAATTPTPRPTAA